MHQTNWGRLAVCVVYVRRASKPADRPDETQPAKNASSSGLLQYFALESRSGSVYVATRLTAVDVLNQPQTFAEQPFRRQEQGEEQKDFPPGPQSDWFFRLNWHRAASRQVIGQRAGCRKTVVSPAGDAGGS